MKVHVRQTSSKKLPMKSASILSLNFGQNDGKERMQQRLVIGTYELPAEAESISDKRERSGGICVVDPNNLLAIERHIRLPSGVFRLVKVPTDDAIGPFLLRQKNTAAIAALTDGRLAFLFVDRFDSADDGSAAPFVSFSAPLSYGMLLDCAVNSDGRLVCSDNLGNLFLLRFSSDGFHSVDFQWRAHSFQFGGPTNDCEIWSCCWADNGQFCASGGEDALLKLWDIRCPTNGPHNAQLTNRSHSAGVVFLASSDSIRKNLDGPSANCPSSPNLLLSGSYDDHLRAFDLRKFDHPISEIKLNGGVWNVERLSNDLLLVACMYGGWSIVRDFPSPSFELIHSNPVNGSHLLYAATSLNSPAKFGGDGAVAKSTIASCTFNDAILRMEEVTFC